MTNPHYQQDAIADLNTERDQRVVREFDEIEVDPSEFEKSVLELGDLWTISPVTFEDALELCNRLGCVMYAMDNLYAKMQAQKDPLSDKIHDALVYTRDAMLQQLCCTDKTMLENYRFYEDAVEHEYRFDKLCFVALLETVACLYSEPGFKASIKMVVPSVKFPELCRKTIIKRSLHDTPIAEFSVFDMVEALKYLEFKWCVIKYYDELPDYLDILLCRLSELYKKPQSYAVFANITDYMQVLTETKAVCSERMIEEMSWSFRPMYQKIHIYRQLARERASFPMDDEDELKVCTLAVDNSRRMNNKSISEKFRNVYMRATLRPSEMPRFYRDKQGRYANAALIMKNTRSKETIELMMEKLDCSAWAMLGAEKPGSVPNKRKRSFDKAASDMMYVLLFDTWVGNMWQIEWMKIFVIFNLDLLEQADNVTDAWFRVDYPLLVQSFNHFDLYYKGVLYEHRSIGKAFCHWYSIMMQAPFHGRFDNHNIQWHELRNLHVLQQERE